MNIPVESNALAVFIAVVFPGLISMHIYRMIMPTRRIDWGKSFQEGLFYGALNFGMCFPIIYLIHLKDFPNTHPVLYSIGVLVVILIAPVLWPMLWLKIAKTRWYARRFQIPHPSAWDWFFDKREPVFVLVHLNDGTKIGGYYGSQSFASAFPDEGDLYLQKVLKTDQQSGEFTGYIDNTRGLLIRRDEYKMIELFAVPKRSGQ